VRLGRRWRLRGRRRKPLPPQRRRSAQEILSHLPEGPEGEEAQFDLFSCEVLAARAATVAGGGSPCWGHTPLGPGEDLALAIEVSRAVRDHQWPPLNPYPQPTNLS
jgi:hypothetical protein